VRGLLEAVDSTGLTAIGKAITDKSGEGFAFAYRHTLEGCYACHKACEKPFLRPQIPNAPNVSILNFDPAAEWPE